MKNFSILEVNNRKHVLFYFQQFDYPRLEGKGFMTNLSTGTRLSKNSRIFGNLNKKGRGRLYSKSLGPEDTVYYFLI